ncbi:hypothetical protein [Hymenobacter sp. PAMC 26628]|uniref:hypothetical protein n=1 Tax=Hymenobacter sp. PAMC 26628 TaxID=1484118 RepID=UPI00077038C0|nr:hypothetical protein [Hymenobacter sp. PAMC 26628]AMJ65667.1 hypothetical protein AXW84_09675 [Hymenobacter sp. PAMC 26628]
MKTYACRLALGLLLLLGALAGPARAQAPAARPGYWNVETNLTTRDYTVVRFYDGHDRLVYEERLAGLCLDLARPGRRRRRTARQLNHVLAGVLRDPAAAGAPTLLAQQLGHDRRLQRLYASR